MKNKILLSEVKIFIRFKNTVFDCKLKHKVVAETTLWLSCTVPNQEPLAWVEKQWGIPTPLISEGTPLFVAQDTNVAEEILYNVIVVKGQSCPGSPLHAPVSSHTATNDVICHLLKKTHTKPTWDHFGSRDYMFTKLLSCDKISTHVQMKNCQITYKLAYSTVGFLALY